MIDKVLAAGGEMGALMRAFDWSKTPLGPVENWPQNLRSAVSFLLSSKAQIILFWGREFTVLYNDAYRPVLATKHPHVLGVSGQECWYETWDFLEPLLQNVVDTGEAFSAQDLQFILFRSGFTEETYFDVSYDPVRDEMGDVDGVFCIVTETTRRVLGERRLRALGDLGTRAIEGESPEETCTIAAETFKVFPEDVPFALFYLMDDNQNVARLVCSAGVEAGQPVSPETINLADPDSAPAWPLAEVATTCEQMLVTDLPGRFSELPPSIWPESIRDALVLPLMSPGQEQCIGFIVMGISPRLKFDEKYDSFFTLAGKHIETAIANARAREAARQRAEALAELNRAKTVFFNNVSHEFRTPLTLILGPLEDLLSNLASDLSVGQRESLDIVYRNSLRLLKLVNSLLDFSRMEAGRIDISFVPVDLATLTIDLASMFRSAIERAGLQYVIDCPPLPEPVYVDLEMWEKIVLNLLSNAFKFTFEGGITVRMRPVADHVELTVQDTGVGIPENELEEIFTRFHRVRDAHSRTYEGSGIGLSLVQDLIHQHIGTIAVESQIDQGTIFTVSIPFGFAHLPQDRIGAQRTLASTSVGAIAYVEEALRWLPDGAVDTTSQDGKARKQIGDESTGADDQSIDIRIMVVDDNADMRDYLARLLASQFVVETHADGESALQAAHENPPDLIVCDVMMPGVDGFAVLRALHAAPKLSAIPVIMLSARAGEEATVEGLEAGANDYLVKPFSVPELLARINTQLEILNLRDQLVEKSAYVARIEERHQLARDLHDSVNQTLFSASIIAQSLPATWKRDPNKVLPYLSKLDQLTRSAMAEMRTLLFQLRPSGMENVNLGDLLILLVAAFKGRSAIDITLNVEGNNEKPPLPFDLRHNFYRIVQESLNNVVKHSRAEHVEITFTQSTEGVVLSIRDDGQGFDALATASGMGLNNMRERAESVGATLHITSLPEHGTEIVLRHAVHAAERPVDDTVIAANASEEC